MTVFRLPTVNEPKWFSSSRNCASLNSERESNKLQKNINVNCAYKRSTKPNNSIITEQHNQTVKQNN